MLLKKPVNPNMNVTNTLEERERTVFQLEDSSSGEDEGEAKKSIADLPTSTLKAVLNAHKLYQSLLDYHPCRDAAAAFLAMDAATLIPAVKAEIQKRKEQQHLDR